MRNALNWFEIPVADMTRAVAFYGAILGVELKAEEIMGMLTAFFPYDWEGEGAGGGLVQGPGYVPSSEGTLVYLNGGDDLATVLDKVEGAGGSVVMPKSSIGENGFMAIFIDSEGNKVGLHSPAVNA
jgi:predicted enzyme related to lactoylglutathione lyase